MAHAGMLTLVQQAQHMHNIEMIWDGKAWRDMVHEWHGHVYVVWHNIVGMVNV